MFGGMKTHELTLLGGQGDEVRVSADDLIEALSALVEGSRRAARFFVEGESVSHGPYPQRLSALTSIEVTGLAPEAS